MLVAEIVANEREKWGQELTGDPLGRKSEPWWAKEMTREDMAARISILSHMKTNAELKWRQVVKLRELDQARAEKAEAELATEAWQFGKDYPRLLAECDSAKHAADSWKAAYDGVGEIINKLMARLVAARKVIAYAKGIPIFLPLRNTRELHELITDFEILEERVSNDG